MCWFYLGFLKFLRVNICCFFPENFVLYIYIYIYTTGQKYLASLKKIISHPKSVIFNEKVKHHNGSMVSSIILNISLPEPH